MKISIQELSENSVVSINVKDNTAVWQATAYYIGDVRSYAGKIWKLIEEIPPGEYHIPPSLENDYWELEGFMNNTALLDLQNNTYSVWDEAHAINIEDDGINVSLNVQYMTELLIAYDASCNVVITFDTGEVREYPRVVSQNNGKIAEIIAETIPYGAREVSVFIGGNRMGYSLLFWVMAGETVEIGDALFPVGDTIKDVSVTSIDNVTGVERVISLDIESKMSATLLIDFEKINMVKSLGEKVIRKDVFTILENTHTDFDIISKGRVSNYFMNMKNPTKLLLDISVTNKIREQLGTSIVLPRGEDAPLFLDMSYGMDKTTKDMFLINIGKSDNDYAIMHSGNALGLGGSFNGSNFDIVETGESTEEIIDASFDDPTKWNFVNDCSIDNGNLNMIADSEHHILGASTICNIVGGNTYVVRFTIIDCFVTSDLFVSSAGESSPIIQPSNGVVGFDYSPIYDASEISIFARWISPGDPQNFKISDVSVKLKNTPPVLSLIHYNPISKEYSTEAYISLPITIDYPFSQFAALSATPTQGDINYLNENPGALMDLHTGRKQHPLLGISNSDIRTYIPANDYTNGNEVIDLVTTNKITIVNYVSDCRETYHNVSYGAQNLFIKWAGDIMTAAEEGTIEGDSNGEWVELPMIDPTKVHQLIENCTKEIYGDEETSVDIIPCSP